MKRLLHLRRRRRPRSSPPPPPPPPKPPTGMAWAPACAPCAPAWTAPATRWRLQRLATARRAGLHPRLLRPARPWRTPSRGAATWTRCPCPPLATVARPCPRPALPRRRPRTRTARPPPLLWPCPPLPPAGLGPAATPPTTATAMTRSPCAGARRRGARRRARARQPTTANSAGGRQRWGFGCDEVAFFVFEIMFFLALIQNLKAERSGVKTTISPPHPRSFSHFPLITPPTRANQGLLHPHHPFATLAARRKLCRRHPHAPPPRPPRPPPLLATPVPAASRGGRGRCLPGHG